MALPSYSEWKLNITTEDIVYPFADDSRTTYRKKTIELVSEAGETETATVITEIIFDGKKTISERTLSESEFSVEQFEALKAWSDDNYKMQERSFVNYHRKAVAQVEDWENTLAAAVFEKFAGDEEETTQDDIRTVENALRILEEMRLTETQKRRFFARYVENQSVREIAEKEGAHFTTVYESLKSVEKKRKRIVSKKFSKSAENTPTKRPKKDIR